MRTQDVTIPPVWGLFLEVQWWKNAQGGVDVMDGRCNGKSLEIPSRKNHSGQPWGHLSDVKPAAEDWTDPQSRTRNALLRWTGIVN